METKISKELKEKFSCLFPKETVMEVTTVASGNGVPNLVRSDDGCCGVLVHGYDFPLGTRITAVVVGKHNDMPLLKPDENWLMSYGPHKARVLFSTALGIAMQLTDKENQYAHFLYEQGFPGCLQSLKSGDEVLVFGLKKIDDDRYAAANVEVLKKSPWPQERMGQAIASGSYKSYRAIVLGELYEADIRTDSCVKLSYQILARRADGRFPSEYVGKRALVRVVFIKPQDILVEFVQLLNAEY